MNRTGIVLALFCTIAAYAGAQSRNFYVAHQGSDRWSGRLAAPNGTRTDGPFATLEGARDALRVLRGGGSLPSAVTVHVRGGTYDVQDTFTLTAEDSGSAAQPITWRAFQREKVRITGGKALEGFRPLTDPALVSRLAPGAREKVVAADIRTLGITDPGTIVQRGGPPMELFFNGERMTVARYPNTGWLHIADVPQSGDSMYNRGLEREKRYDGIPAGRHYGRISYDGNRPSSWKQTSDIYLHGYWTFDWSDTYQQVKSIDTVQREMTLLPPHHHYGYTRNQRYYVLNILEELDAPGEWYLDRERGLVFFWPPARLTGGSVTVSLLEKPLVSIDGSAWLRWEGFTFDCSRGKGFAITGGHDVTIDRCTFRNLGREAVTIEGGTRNGVMSCHIHGVGLGGILLQGGNRRTLIPAGHFALNNHIHDYSTWLRSGQYAVVMDGVGHRVANNLIHDSPFEGLYIKGNDHIIEYNEFHHLMKETGDAGAIHTGRDLSWRGNVIRYNYFHDLTGPGLHGVMAVYLDDWASGFTVVGNLFYRAGRATLIGGGRDNTVENNIYVECSPSLHVDARGLGWASYFFDGTLPYLFTKMDEVHASSPPYTTRYPELLQTMDGEPAVPKYNRIVGNISYGGRWMDIYDYQAFDFSVVTVSGNIIADPVILRRREDGAKGWDPYYLNIDMTEGYLAYRSGDPAMSAMFIGNLLTQGNPGVMAPEKGDFRFRKNSPAEKLGFAPTPREKIGLQRPLPPQ